MAHFEKRVRALQTSANTNVEQIVMLTDAIAKIRELFERDGSIYRSNYSKIIETSAGCTTIFGPD